jgi:HAD superfamily hydrolase (TIGR01662 family)
MEQRKAHKLTRPQLVFFDWDGTILDTQHVMDVIFNNLISENTSFLLPENKELSAKQLVDRYCEVGMTLELMMTAIFQPQEINFLTDSFCAMYDVVSKELNIKLFPDIKKTLKLLNNAGIPVALVSNKATDRLLEDVKQSQMHDFFNVIVGAGECPLPKPSRQPVDKALDKLVIAASDVNFNQCWFIGDTQTDINCAKNCGVLPFLYRDGLTHIDGDIKKEIDEGLIVHITHYMQLYNILKAIL